jgi:hypothetical protein
MVRFPWISRRIVVGVVVFTLTLGGFQVQSMGSGITDGTSNTLTGGIARIIVVEEN